MNSDEFPGLKLLIVISFHNFQQSCWASAEHLDCVERGTKKTESLSFWILNLVGKIDDNQVSKYAITNGNKWYDSDRVGREDDDEGDQEKFPHP